MEEREVLNESMRQHPMTLLKREIKEKGIVCIDGVHSLPSYSDPYISDNMVVCLNISGQADVEYDMQPASFKKHDISVIFPNHIIVGKSTSEDYKALMIVVSSEFFDQLRRRATYRNHLAYQLEPAFNLNDEQYESIINCYNLIKTISKLESPMQKAMLINAMDILSQLLDEFRFSNSKYSWTSNEQIFIDFYDALIENYSRSREVKFYAGKACLSPKYFGTIIKQTTGTSVGEWIANYVILQAKSLLSNSARLSIQQIALKLGFTDQATFCRYFKTHTGISPKSYRYAQREKLNFS